jgi:hypothetical protein
MKSKKNLFFKILTITLVCLCTIVMSQPSNAYVITPDNGWKTFNFGGVGSKWDKIFSFDLLTPGILSITDAFLAGDLFEVFNIGISLGFTSTPTVQPEDRNYISSNYDAAALDPRWSTGSWNLDAGSYVISGIATQSPFNIGTAALRVDTATIPISEIATQSPFNMSSPALRIDPSPVPEPSTILLLGASLTGLVALRRKPRF